MSGILSMSSWVNVFGLSISGIGIVRRFSRSTVSVLVVSVLLGCSCLLVCDCRLSSSVGVDMSLLVILLMLW